MKPPSQRQLRVGELVRHALSDVLTRGDVHRANLGNTLVSVSEVRMSPDLKIATAFVTPIGPGDAEAICRQLAKAQGELRRDIGRQLKLRFTPSLRFLPDTSFDQFGRIDEILRSPEVSRDTDPHRGSEGDKG
ncbi:MAG: 30S ribosome-binding factor RbfA [Pseudomonadota bacterium]